MIITKTPFRISFFGGGTDYPAWFKEHGGAVLSTTIDKYCYLSCRFLPPFFDFKTRVVWSKIEMVKDHEDILHPSVNAVLKHLGMQDGLHIHHDADLPARTGLGSSSSFTVGLLHALHGLRGKMVSKENLAKTAIEVEQNIIRENVGCQDQIAAAFGGLNKIEFQRNGYFNLTPITLPLGRLTEFQNNLMLVFTGFSRTASEIAAQQIKEMHLREKELQIMYDHVNQAIDILHSDIDIGEFGKLLDEAWRLKRSLTSSISNPKIDEIYDTAKNAGTIGGKLLGAGGGGFILLFVKPEKKPEVRKALTGLLEVPFEFENQGSQIIFYKP